MFLKTINNKTGIDSAIQSEQVETLDPASCSSSICTAEINWEESTAETPW